MDEAGSYSGGFRYHEKSSGFDAVLADKRFGELKSLLAGGFDGIYTGDAQAIDKANKTLTLKRKLMLMSRM